MNIQEIFTWYFEQKGVDNPERFLGVNNAGAGVNDNWLNLDPQTGAEQSLQTPLQEPEQESIESVQAVPQVQAEPEKPLGQIDKNTLQIVLQILTNFIAQKGKRTNASDFINVLSEILEEK